MIIQLTASAVRSRAKRAGFEKAIYIRTGRRACAAELEYVDSTECSVRIAVMKPGVDEFLDELSKENVDKMPKYRCPKCKESLRLEVTIKAWARIVEDVQADGEVNIETDMDLSHDPSHEWDSDSAMICRDCGHGSIAEDFELENQEDQ